jgi:hypothetical protein
MRRLLLLLGGHHTWFEELLVMVMVIGEGGRRARGGARGQMEFFPPIFQNGAPKMPTEDSTLLQLIARRASII